MDEEKLTKEMLALKTKMFDRADAVELILKKEYSKTLKLLEKEIFAYIARYGTDGNLPYSEQRVLALMRELIPLTDGLYELEDKKVTELLTKTYEDNYYQGLYTLSKNYNAAWNFAKVDERAIKAAISMPWSGLKYGERIQQNKKRIAVVLRQEITQSLIRGDAPRKTVAIVANRLKISRNYASVLVQSETAATLTQSDKAMYKEYGVEQYEYTATLDKKTTDTCKSLDGRIFDVNDMVTGKNAPPMHARCRSTTIPRSGKELALRIAKRIDTGKAEYIPATISYREWEQKFIR